MLKGIDPNVKQTIYDLLEGWELVEFLQIDIEEIVEAFENEIIENIEDVKDLVGIRSNNE